MMNMDTIIKKILMLILLSLIPATTDAKDYLPTVFWNPGNPALNRQQWSKVVNVNLFQTLTFLCPTNLINVNRVKAPNPNTESYYNLYVREISSSETNLDYNTICDTTKSNEVFFCNQSRSALTLTPETYKRFQINTRQAQPTDPEFQYGKDYIFFSTSDGRQETLRTNSTKCTMVFRIHLCQHDEKCSISKCSTYGREEVCTSSAPGFSTTAPRNVTITAVTTSSLTISWKEPLTTSSNVMYYSICYRKSLTQACQIKIVESQMRSAVLENLDSSTNYKIRVRAHTSKGPGNYSTDISQNTKRFSTTAPRDVRITAFTTSSLTISWKEPLTTSSNITYYSICYRKSLTQACQIKIVESQMRSAVLEDLDSSTNYKIRVRAHTSKGTGNYSTDISQNTRRFSTTAPINVTITAFTTSSFTISWKEPLTTSSNITYYSICYRKSLTQACQIKIVESQMRSAVLENLDSSTNYKIRVRAQTSKAPGQYCMDISQITRDESFISSEPQEVTVSNITGSSAKLTWKEPNDIKEDVVFYKICCRESSKQDCVFKLVEPHNKSTVLNDLKASTEYGIHIRPYTSKGLGNHSKEIHFNTTVLVSAEPPTAGAQSSDSTIHYISLLIGFFIGAVVILLVVVSVRLVYRTRPRRKEKSVQDRKNEAYRNSVRVDIVNNTISEKECQLNHVELNSFT